MINIIKTKLKNAGAANSGTVPLRKLAAHMPDRAIERIRQTLPGARSVICAAFPYYTGQAVGNIAKYARGLDYHAVVGDRLQKAAENLDSLLKSHAVLVDASPLPEVAAARLSGTAMTGLHGLAICPPFGSYVVLGCILTSAELPACDDAGFCDMCGRCAAACPSGAISFAEGSRKFDRGICASHLTQSKSPPGKQERDILRRSDYIWGCDHCMDACPHNLTAGITQIREFRDGLIPSLTLEQLETLTDDDFQRLYGDRAFAWRGKNPLIRTLEYKSPACEK